MKKVMAALIVVPILLVSIVGLISLLSFSTALTESENAELSHAKSLGITALVGEYTAFLTDAAELDAVKAAASKSEAGEQAKPVLSAYAENGFGVYDILITNSQGFIFASHSGNYSNSETFRDVSELVSIASSPNPVSGFYEGGRFYCAKPIRTSTGRDIIGYIILKTDSDIISSYVQHTTPEDCKGVFAVFDENGNIISSAGEVSGVLKDRVAAHSDRSLTEERFMRGRDFGAAGNIDGTRWRWISLYPRTASLSAFKVFGISFAIAAGVCAINVVIMIIFTRRMKKTQPILIDKAEE
jgi:hypothetical protein